MYYSEQMRSRKKYKKCSCP